MSRWLIAVAVIAGACDRESAAPPAPPWTEATLACVATKVIAIAKATPKPVETADGAIDIVPFMLRGSADYGIDPAAARAYVQAIANASPALGAGAPLVVARAAPVVAELGDRPAARALAERAFAASTSLSAGDHRELVPLVALAVAWSGDSSRALAVAGTDPLAKVMAAEGMARAGDRAGAQRALADATAHPADGPWFVAALAQSEVWAGELEPARALVAAAAPDARPAMQLYVADAAVQSHAPEAGALVDAARSDVRAATAAGSADDELVGASLWSELVRLREQLGGPAAVAARVELDDWLLAGDPHAPRRQLLGIDALRAQIAGQPKEADRLLAAAGADLGSLAKLEMALARGQYAVAFDLLEVHQRERAALPDHGFSALPAPLDETITTAEAEVWLQFTAAPRDAELVTRFRALMCK